MSFSRRQILAMTLLVLLPLGVTAITAYGLWQLDRDLEGVSEEYGELRMLQPIDRSLDSAMVALGSDDPKLHASARKYLEAAHAALVRYLGTQSHTVEPEEHQELEVRSALALMKQLQLLLSSEGQQKTPGEQAAIVVEASRSLAELEQVTDNCVRAAHKAARSTRKTALIRAVLASIGCAGLCILLSVWSTRSVNQRLRELHRRLAAHAGKPPKPPMGLVGMVSQIEELNSRMIDKIEESGRELLRRERLAGIGLLAADVAHEINNPMNAMLGLSEVGLKSVEKGPIDEPARDELAESLRVIRREALRCKAIVQRLMAMVRTDQPPAWFDATQLVRETVHVAQAARPDKASSFVVTGGDVNVLAFGRANDVRQILLTLLMNAADAIPVDGRIEADVTKTDKEVWLRVRDNGRGFTEAMRQTFFTPFKSYREDGTGTGLGLSIAQALAESMGATLRPFSEGPDMGSMFVLAIPTPEGRP